MASATWKVGNRYFMTLSLPNKVICDAIVYAMRLMRTSRTFLCDTEFTNDDPWNNRKKDATMEGYLYCPFASPVQAPSLNQIRMVCMNLTGDPYYRGSRSVLLITLLQVQGSCEPLLILKGCLCSQT